MRIPVNIPADAAEDILALDLRCIDEAGRQVVERTVRLDVAEAHRNSWLGSLPAGEAKVTESDADASDSTAETKDELPTSWIDSDTGHRVIRLTREPNSASLYFNENGYTPDGKRMIYTTREGISLLDLSTLQTRSVVPGEVRAICVGRKTPTVYYVKLEDRALYSTHLDTGETRKIAELPRRGRIATINADESLAAGTYVEGEGKDYNQSGSGSTPRAGQEHALEQPANKGNGSSRPRNRQPYVVALQLQKLSPEEVDAQLSKAYNAIKARMGKPPLTVAFPFNARTPEVVAAALKYHIAYRDRQLGTGGKSTVESLNTWADRLVKEKSWGIVMTHAIASGYAALSDPEVLRAHLKYVKSRDREV